MKRLVLMTSAFVLMSGMAVAQEHMLPSNHGRTGVVEPISESGAVLIAIKDGKNHYLRLDGTEWDPKSLVHKVTDAPQGDRFHPIANDHWANNPAAQDQNLITASRSHFIREDEGDDIFYRYAPDGYLPDLPEADDDEYVPTPSHRSDTPIDQGGLPARKGTEGAPVDNTQLAPEPPLYGHGHKTYTINHAGKRYIAIVDEKGDVISRQTIDIPTPVNDKSTRTSTIKDSTMDQYSREAAYKRKMAAEGITEEVLLETESDKQAAKSDKELLDPRVVKTILHLDKKINIVNAKLNAIKKVNEVTAVAGAGAVLTQAQVNHQLRVGQAINLAIGGIPDASSKERPVAFGTALGHLHGETAIAVAAHARLTDSFVVKGAVGTDFKFENIGGTIGVGFSF